MTVIADDLELLLNDPQHPAKIIGTVTAPVISPDPLTVTKGDFNLFIEAEDQPQTRKMCYSMYMTAEKGQIYYFEGFKKIHDDPGFDVWLTLPLSTLLFMKVTATKIL